MKKFNLEKYLKGVEEEFDNYFDIGLALNKNNKIYQYAIRNKNGNCADVNNEDIKQFITNKITEAVKLSENK